MSLGPAERGAERGVEVRLKQTRRVVPGFLVLVLVLGLGFCEEMNPRAQRKTPEKSRAEEEGGESPTEGDAALLNHSIR